jgi:hypothetical protein
MISSIVAITTASQTRRVELALLPAQMDDDVDACDLVTRQWLRQRVDQHARFGNVEQPIFVIDKEMVMSGRVGIEIGY